MRETPGSPDAAASEGGDPVCWLHFLCESCGALLEHETDPHRPGCEVIKKDEAPS